MIEKTLYHYTCREHGHRGLGDVGRLRVPDSRTLSPLKLIWLTDLEIPMAEPLGLTHYTLACDRTEIRYRVTDNEGIEPWHEHRRELPEELVWPIELAPGAMPMHWFVAATPVPVIHDPWRK